MLPNNDPFQTQDDFISLDDCKEDFGGSFIIEGKRSLVEKPRWDRVSLRKDTTTSLQLVRKKVREVLMISSCDTHSV